MVATLVAPSFWLAVASFFLLGAVISARWGMDVCLVAAAAAFVVQALIIVMSPAARLAGIPEQSAAAC